MLAVDCGEEYEPPVVPNAGRLAFGHWHGRDASARKRIIQEALTVIPGPDRESFLYRDARSGHLIHRFQPAGEEHVINLVDSPANCRRF